MNDCEALRSVDISSLNERECAFLLDVLQALMDGPATLTAATRKSAKDSYAEVERRLRVLESQGLATHKSSIKSGHLVPEFMITDRGRATLALTDRVAANP